MRLDWDPELIGLSLDHLDQGIAIFDAGFRVVLFNRRFVELLDMPVELTKAGTPLEAFFRLSAERGEYGAGDIDDLVRERMESVATLTPHTLRRVRPNGTVLNISRRPLPGGGFVSTYTDVTEETRTRDALVESTSLLTALLDHSPASIAVRDLQGCYRLVNKAYEQLFGVPRLDVLGKTPKDFLSQAFAKDLAEIDRQVIETGAPVIHERHRHLPGGETDLFVVRFPIRDDGGAVVSVGAIVLDVTEHKRTEAVKNRFGRIIEQSLNEIYVFDAETLQFLEVNRGARRNLGYAMAELRAMTPLDIKPEHTPESFAALIDPLRRGGQEHILFETIHRRQDGTTYDAEIHLQFMGRETPPVFVAIVWDISRRKRVREELRQALVRAEEANQAKSQFLATMSHELRTPLNAILGFAEILRQQYFGPLGAPPYEEYANDIMTSGQHLLALINDILDLSTIEAGAQVLNMEDMRVADVAEDCSRIVAVSAARKGLEFLIDVPGDLPGLRGDRRAIFQILINLLSNAVKYTPAGGRVRLAVSATAGSHIFTVTDTGQGVSRELLPMLTDPFLRAGNDPYHSHDGTGLGLTIVEALTKLHGGLLRIDSDLGSGTCVTVTLPSACPNAGAGQGQG